MRPSNSFYHAIAGICCLCIFVTCREEKKKEELTLEMTSEEMSRRISAGIKEMIMLDEPSLHIRQPELAKIIYEKQRYVAIWSGDKEWNPIADSLYEFIKGSMAYGLFPDDYHLKDLKETRRRFIADSLYQKERKDPQKWTIADIQLTDAFLQIVKDVKLGRLPNDSVTLNKDSILTDAFYLEQFARLRDSMSLTEIIRSLEPDQREYRRVREGVKKFLEIAKFKTFTIVPSPKDSLDFKKLLQKRLFEGGYLATDTVVADSAHLAIAVKKFQKEKGITVDGIPGEGTIRMLNLSDKEKFYRIAISLDKFKKLPAKMPDKYIWVNASSNMLEVIEDGEVKFSSKVITGKPKTRTPVLTSNVSALITYPQWVPPPSIIQKEILPAVKKNPAYLAKKGFSLLNSKGEEVDPFSVDWSKYNKSIPYKVVQGSGDANALGIMKFHFDNKYSVYLHDTNQRYLFAQAMRSLSHGCVRVQEWQKLMMYLLRNDSTDYKGKYTRIDSVNTWLKRKEKHQLPLRNRIPVFIRYITCDNRGGQLEFYDDVYGEDLRLKEKYFASNLYTVARL